MDLYKSVIVRIKDQFWSYSGPARIGTPPGHPGIGHFTNQEIESLALSQQLELLGVLVEKKVVIDSDFLPGFDEVGELLVEVLVLGLCLELESDPEIMAEDEVRLRAFNDEEFDMRSMGPVGDPISNRGNHSGQVGA